MQKGLTTHGKNSNNNSAKATGNLTENLKFKRPEMAQENGEVFEKKISDNQVFVFGNTLRNALLSSPLWNDTKCKIYEEISKEKESTGALKEEGNEIQNSMVQFITDDMDATSICEKNSTGFTFEQISNETSSPSLLVDSNNTSKIVQSQENISFSENNETNIQNFPSSPTVNMVSTCRKPNHSISIPKSIEAKIEEFVFSLPKNAFKFSKNITEKSNSICSYNADKSSECTLNYSLKNFHTPWKQTISNVHDVNSNDASAKNSAILSGNLTLKRHEISEKKKDSFETNISENQSSLQVNALRQRRVLENAAENKSQSICMKGNKHEYNLCKEKNNERSHLHIQTEKRVSGTSLEWCISDKEHKFNTSNQNLQSCTKHKPCIHPDTISPTFNFFKRSNGRMSGSFNDKIKRAEKLHCPEAISAFSLNTASNKTSLPDVDVNRANSGIRDFEKEDSRIGSKEKRLLSHSDTEQSGDKQIIQGYEHPAFSFSSENDNNGSKFYVGKTSSYVKSSVNNNIWSKFYDGETHNYSKSSVNNNSRSTFYGGKTCNYVGSSINNFCNAYSKTRRRISFSDSTEDEINDKDTCCLNRIKSPRETLLRTGYFLNVRKTKHFYLPTKTENAHTVDKLQQHHNPSSKTRESNESWFKKDSDHRSLAEYIYIEKPKQRKRKATLQMKQISSENESEEFGREYSYINNQNMRRKQDGVSAKIKERLFIETDSQNGGKSNRLTFSIKNCPTHISITGNGNLRLESESPENEKIYWIRNSGSSLNEEDILSSSPPAGSSDDENFHFHGSTDTSSDGEFSSEYSSKQRNPERRISTSPSSCISETHQIHSESDISVANDDEKTENNTAVWKTSLDDTRDNFREFAGNVEQDENGADDYLITAENIIQNHVNLENSKSKIYHLKYGNINLRFYDTPRNHVTLRLISENECPQTDWHSKEKRNSEHYLAIKELKPTSFDKEESYSAFGSDVDSSIDEASASDASPAFNKSEDLEEAASSHIGKNKTTDTETIKFDFIPDKGISEIKFRRMPAVTYLQYKSEKTKLYFKKKYS